MARSVSDAALLFSAMAGPDPRSPISLSEPGSRFDAPLERDFAGVRVAFSRDLGGLPVDRRVRGAIEEGRTTFVDLGCVVEPAEPDLTDADQVFQVLRAWGVASGFAGTPASTLAKLKDTLVWNLQKGRRLSGAEVSEAERTRTRLFRHMHAFMEDYEFLIAPVSQVPPFEVKQRWVREIEGVAMETYIDWMKSCSRITVTGHPAISVPCGFTPEGLPVGMQIVGRHRDDFGVLQLAHAFEQARRAGERRPPGLYATTSQPVSV